jgi:transcriptional regulator with XRE-family HTH domain
VTEGETQHPTCPERDLNVAFPKDLDPSSSPRAFFGAELRRVREAAGLSQDKLGERIFCSGSYIGQLESATRKPQLDLAERVDAVLETGGYFVRMWPMVVKSRHAAYFAEAAELEETATSISQYVVTVAPGLLQTEAYARAVIRAANPLAADADVEFRVRARLDRARLLDTATAPRLWEVVHETALRIPTGGAVVMREQLAHIADLVRSNRILLQVLPFSAGPSPVTAGMFSLMAFDDAPPVAYSESGASGQLIDDPLVVTAYQQAYDLMRAAALSREASLGLIESAMEDYGP